MTKEKYIDEARSAFNSIDADVATNESLYIQKVELMSMLGVDLDKQDPREWKVPKEYAGALLISAAIKEVAAEIRRSRWESLESDLEGTV